MKGTGSSSIPYHEESGEKIHLCYVDKVFIEKRQSEQFLEQREQDKKFKFRFDNGFIKAKYLKKCYEIIQHNLGYTVGIASRTNKIYGIDLREFEQTLRKCFSQEELKKIKNLKVGTSHSFKGLEMDIVIVLQACDGNFPLIHPDFELFEIFGQTIDKVIEEERRLFYVTISRAKEKLYILTESDNESEYLELYQDYEHDSVSSKSQKRVL